MGEGYTMSAQSDGEDRDSTIAYNLTKYLLDTRFKKSSQEETPLHLFPQVKRIVRQWLKKHFEVVGHIKPSAVFKYKHIREKVGDIIYTGITTDDSMGEPPIRPILDPYNPSGSTKYVGFNTAQDLWTTAANKCHINYCVLDSDWEGECCRAIENHPAVVSYAKNHNLGFEVPYQHNGETHMYRPDFIVLVNDGRGSDDLLHLIIEIKGQRKEDAQRKAETMKKFWLPAVKNAGNLGRWAFAEFQEPFEINERLQALITKAIEENA